MTALSTRKFSGAKLRQARKAVKMSRRTLADMLRVTEMTIYNWETDRFSPNSTTLFRMADALGKSADDFYE